MAIENIQRILAAYEQADATDLREGLLAYPRYHTSMQRIATYYSMGFCQVVAAFVSLSPNNDFTGNLRSTIAVIEGARDGVPVEDIRTSTYKACRDRAYAYLTGQKDFLMETRGPKVRAFYHNIIRPECGQHVTIDGHMANLWSDTLLTMVQVVRTRFSYRAVEKDFKLAARRLGLVPCQLQATLWFTWKRTNRIVYSPQLHLFDRANQWRTEVHVEHLEQGAFRFPNKEGAA